MKIKITIKHIIIKLSKIKDRILKAAKRKRDSSDTRESPLGCQWVYLHKSCVLGKSELMYSKCLKKNLTTKNTIPTINEATLHKWKQTFSDKQKLRECITHHKTWFTRNAEESTPSSNKRMLSKNLKTHGNIKFIVKGEYTIKVRII